jgi:hypothetical protein
VDAPQLVNPAPEDVGRIAAQDSSKLEKAGAGLHIPRFVHHDNGEHPSAGLIFLRRYFA